MNFDIRFVAV